MSHDKLVKKLAQQYESQGYKVKADIDGYPTPQNINGARPDIIAQKKNEMKLCEVETPTSMKTDIEQRRTFRDYTKNKKGATFRVAQTGKKK